MQLGVVNYALRRKSEVESDSIDNSRVADNRTRLFSLYGNYGRPCLKAAAASPGNEALEYAIKYSTSDQCRPRLLAVVIT
jgi:hypothetical protein